MDHFLLDLLPPSFLAIFGFMVTLTFLARRFTLAIDSDLSPETRNRISDHLTNLAVEEAKWIDSFNYFFFIIFGEKQLSWKCLKSSILCSIFFFMFFCFLFVGAELTINVIRLTPVIFRLDDAIFNLINYIVIFSIIGNIITDFLSVWLTRRLISMNFPNFIKITLNIVLIYILVFLLFQSLLLLITYFGFTDLLQELFDKDALDTEGAYIGLAALTYIMNIFNVYPPQSGTFTSVLFVTSFITSIWLMLHLLSLAIIKYLPKIVIRLDVDRYPLRAIGTVSIGILWLIAIFFYIYYLFFKSFM